MLTIFLLISQGLVAYALRFHFRYDAKGQRLHDPAASIEEIKRQTLPIANGPGFGIETIDASLRDAARTTTTKPSFLLPPITQTSISVPKLTVEPTATITDMGIPTYVFPTSIVQVPVATICPYNTTTVNHTSPSTTTFPPASSGLFNGTTGKLTAESEHNAQPRIVEHDADTARIIFGDDMCQTLYAPKETAICSTSIRIPGSLAVRITRCDQWVTFSTASPTSCPSSSTIVHPTVSAIPLSGRDVAVLNISSSTTTTSVAAAVVSISSSPLSIPTPTTTTSPIDSVRDILYYVAHWWDLASHDVPEIVRVEDCAASSTGNACVAHTESWRESSTRSTETGLSTITYSGPVILTSSTNTLTTTISISSTITTTRTVTVPTIIRSIFNLTGTATARKGPTITVSMTGLPTTRTYSLESLSTRTVTRRVTVTRTVVVETETMKAKV